MFKYSGEERLKQAIRRLVGPLAATAHCPTRIPTAEAPCSRARSDSADSNVEIRLASVDPGEQVRQARAIFDLATFSLSQNSGTRVVLDNHRFLVYLPRYRCVFSPPFESLAS